MILEEEKDERKVPFATLIDMCHLKNDELEPKFQKYKDRVVLRGDIVKDAYAVFTEQGSSASQMTASKVMDVIARPPDCDGQGADAVSPKTQVKMKDTPRLLRIPMSECTDIWIRLPRHTWLRTWMNIEDAAVPHERNLYGHPLAGLLCKGHYEGVLLKLEWEKVQNWACLFVHRIHGLFLSVSVDDIKMAGNKQNMAPMWKKLMKKVGFG